MAKPKIPNQKRKYQELNTRLNKYVSLVEQIFDTLNLEAAKIACTTDYDADGNSTFKFTDYPQTRKRVQDLQAQFVNDISAVIYRGTSEEWKNSNVVQDMLAKKVLGAYDAQVGGEKNLHYFEQNSDAMRAFQNRKDRGMSLSTKLWQQSDDYKSELESAVSCALQKGTSAVTLSKQLSQYLKDFKSLQNDYKELYGEAANIKDCEYRSIRLARSEINMAYRSAENERWKQMDFVVGFEIKTTQNRKHVADVCDELKGKYPKDFEWTGWHPNCMCYKIPILKTEEEFWEWDGRDEATTASINEVKDVPENFKLWVDNNIQRAKSWSSAPYFIRDNEKYIREDFKVDVYNKTEKLFVRKRRTALAMSRVEYYNKTYPHIPEVRQAAVNAYTQAIVQGNKNATFREINRRLRRGTEDEYVDAASTLISECLKDMPVFDGVVYRGETMSMKKLKERFLNHIGEVVSDKGFYSTSKYADTPKKFISHDGVPKSHKRVIFEIQSKNGRDISKISEFNGIFTLENQHEVLFDKRTKFLILPDMKEENGILKIKLVEQ